MQVGVSMNHNQLCACIDFNNIVKADYINSYTSEIMSQIITHNLTFDYAGIQQLYK